HTRCTGNSFGITTVRHWSMAGRLLTYWKKPCPGTLMQENTVRCANWNLYSYFTYYKTEMGHNFSLCVKAESSGSYNSLRKYTPLSAGAGKPPCAYALRGLT